MSSPEIDTLYITHLEKRNSQYKYIYNSSTERDSIEAVKKGILNISIAISSTKLDSIEAVESTHSLSFSFTQHQLRVILSQEGWLVKDKGVKDSRNIYT